ncbi:tRNA lysidine(34) synthetase TilS [Salipiger bermudensis]|uniref:tRNA lysidine(34) synthetase TilS n=1 Tax=Salipiger bermudensis TaxID=344736 RepID=UPI001CD770FC|nr:tRNA lysidine(34) synthetase TilS [Salipiger bermudensis]MCA1285407.1 tRNA lysidine(34) synthetase TilS [Salipiger bermudensis]
MTAGADSLDQRFAEAMGAALGPDFPSDIVLAVSGGGDSMAMLTLAHNWAHVWGTRLWVVTVDHGLRPEAGNEAALVRETCDELGHPHTTLRWRWDGQGNLMDAARRARLDLIGRWRGGLSHVLLAHTRDDVAETFLMRLARGSGVDGLSAMTPLREVAQTGTTPLDPEACDGARPPEVAVPSALTIVRPCLDMRRAELRHYLRVLKGRWVEDPTNEDDHYERARIRKLLRGLEAEGLGAETLAATAGRMGRAREALRARAVWAWEQCGQEGVAGDLVFERDRFAALERDTQLRLLAAALQWVASAEYRPRATALEGLLERLLSGGAGTLMGCAARAERDRLRVWREYAAVAGTSVTVGDTALWDGRWRVFHPDLRGHTVQALGEEGWRQAAPAREVRVPHALALCLPSVWQGETLRACDALGVGPGGTTTLEQGETQGAGFKGFLLSH